MIGHETGIHTTTRQANTMHCHMTHDKIMHGNTRHDTTIQVNPAQDKGDNYNPTGRTICEDEDTTPNYKTLQCKATGYNATQGARTHYNAWQHSVLYDTPIQYNSRRAQTTATTHGNPRQGNQYETTRGMAIQCKAMRGKAMQYTPTQESYPTKHNKPRGNQRSQPTSTQHTACSFKTPHQ